MNLIGIIRRWFEKDNEIGVVLVGDVSRDVVHAFAAFPISIGNAYSVRINRFEANDALRKNRLIGFYHTHPNSRKAYPSQRDIGTMEAWTFAAGHSLACIIHAKNETKCFIFSGDKFFDARFTKIADTFFIEHRLEKMDYDRIQRT